jgi:hypothetical protein
MNFNFEFAPLLPWPFIWAFAALAVAAISFMLAKRIKGAVLRSLTALVLLATLANPIIRQDERQPLTDIAVAVVDESQSQAIGKRTDQTQKALTDLKKRIAQLGNTELRVANVTSGIAADADGTRAFTVLNRAIADVPKDRFAGAIMITDGQVHDVPGKLNNLPAPIHSLITGSKSENDRRLLIDRSPHFGIVGQEQTIQFHVEDLTDSASVPVTIQIPGEPPRVMDVAPGVVTETQINITHAGQNLAEISAATREGELSTQNNRVVTVIDGIRDRLRVLLVSGQPHPGERTWRNLLKADASVDLVHFTILRPPEKQDGTPTKELSLIAFPTRELFIDKLDQFDLVIFDRYRRQAILPDSYLANVADYVRNGGAVLIASGPDFADPEGLYSTPLSEILSAAPTGLVTETPYKPALTDLGKRHPVTRDLPGALGPDGKPTWGRWFRLIDTNVAPEAETLMSGPDNRPLLVLNRLGEGRVAQLLSDHGWLWARGYEGGGPQTELLRRMAHWLMKEPDLEEEALTAKQVGGNIVIERRSLGNTVKPITLIAPSGKTQTIALAPKSPGVFSAQIPAAEAGLHTLSDGTLQAAAAIGNADAKESADIRATTSKLEPIAKATGGNISWLEDGMPTLSKASVGQLMSGSGWMALRSNGLYRVTAIHEISLFSTLLSLAILLLAASAMWFREGH